MGWRDALQWVVLGVALPLRVCEALLWAVATEGYVVHVLRTEPALVVAGAGWSLLLSVVLAFALAERPWWLYRVAVGWVAWLTVHVAARGTAWAMGWPEPCQGRVRWATTRGATYVGLLWGALLLLAAVQSTHFGGCVAQPADVGGGVWQVAAVSGTLALLTSQASVAPSVATEPL